MMPNNNGLQMQSEYQHQYPTNNQMDIPYSSDPYMQSTGTGQQTMPPNRRMNMMPQHAPPSTHHHHSQTTIHQVREKKSMKLPENDLKRR